MTHHRFLFTFSVAPALALFSVLVGFAWPVQAQVFRCAIPGGTEYINNAKDAQARGCKTVEGGNVTVVQGTAAQKAPVKLASSGPAASSPAPQPATSADQKARDSDSRLILQSELKKAETRFAEQQKEFNNGEPEKQGIESRNYQRYLDRVAELKDAMARQQSDIAGLKREIARLPASAN